MAMVPVRERHIPLEELCRLPSFSLPTLSWAGDRLAYVGDNTGRLELYVMDLATRAARQVGHGELPRTMRAAIAWGRTDRSIIFAKDEDGNEQHDLYRIDVESGAVTRISHDPDAQEFPGKCSPDNAWLTVATNKRRPESPDWPGQLNLWKVRLDGTAYQPLTNFAFPVFGGGTWSDDGRWIALNANEDPSDLKNIDGYLRSGHKQWDTVAAGQAARRKGLRPTRRLWPARWRWRGVSW